jgi:hypothetical protein
VNLIGVSGAASSENGPPVLLIEPHRDHRGRPIKFSYETSEQLCVSTARSPEMASLLKIGEVELADEIDDATRSAVPPHISMNTSRTSSRELTIQNLRSSRRDHVRSSNASPMERICRSTRQSSFANRRLCLER